MGEEVDAQEFTRADRTRHREKVRRCLDVFARMLREARFDTDDPMTGLEVELNLVDDHGDPALKNAEALAAIADFQEPLTRRAADRLHRRVGLDIKACRHRFRKRVHRRAPDITRCVAPRQSREIAVGQRCKRTGPGLNHSVGLRRLQRCTETSVPDGEILRSMIKSHGIGSPCRHPSADASAFLENPDIGTVGHGSGHSQAGDPCTDNAQSYSSCHVCRSPAVAEAINAP